MNTTRKVWKPFGGPFGPWLAIGLGLIALISYSQATDNRHAAPDAAGLNQALAARQGLTLTTVSPDGHWLASVNRDGWVQLYDLLNDQTLATPLGRPGVRVTGLAFGPNSASLAGSLDDGKILVWDMASGMERLALPGHGGYPVESLVFSPGGGLLASSGADRLIKLWNTTSGETYRVLPGHGGAPILSVAFTPDGRGLLSGGGDHRVKRWDVVKGQETAALSGFAATPDNIDIAATAKGQVLAGIAQDGAVALWKLDAGAGSGPVVLPDQDKVRNVAVAFSADGASVAGIGADNRARIWDTASGELRQILSGAVGAHFTAVAFDPQRGVLAVAFDNQTINLWDIASGALAAAPIGVGDTLSTLAYTPNGANLIGQGRSGQVTVWALPSGIPRYAAQGVAPLLGGAWATAQDPVLAASAASRASWNKAATTEPAPSRTAKPPASAPPGTGANQQTRPKGGVFAKFARKSHWKGLTALGISQDGGSLVATGRGGQLRILNADGTRRFTLKGHHGQAVTGAAFSADGKRLVSVGHDTEIEVWNAADGRAAALMRGPEQPPRAVATSQGGSIAVAGEDTRIFLYDGQTGKLARILKGHRDFVNALAFNPAGTLLASGGADTGLALWAVNGGGAVRILPCGAEINSVAFSPDGAQVAVGTADGMVSLWDSDTGRLARVFQGHSASVRSVAFNRDGKRLASAGEDAKVMVWSLPEGRLHKVLTGTSPVNAVVFGPGKRLYTGGEDNRLDEWDSDSGGKLKTSRADVPESPASPWAALFGRVLDWLVPAASAAIPAAPGGPVLVITSGAAGTPANPNFTGYYAEILRAEGFNEFALSPLSGVTAQTLAGYDVAILAPMALSAAQVDMLNAWVNAGGNLIAMRPDAQLAGLLGLNRVGGSLGEAYFLVDGSKVPGNGIGVDGRPMQFHGVADLYTLDAAAGTQAIARLYSGFATATSNPAVTWRGGIGAGGGSAAAFAFDLATSLVYSRQGNPAWSAQERDGLAPIRSDDKFYGNAVTAPLIDPQPDWVDLAHEVAVPQADEQQRLLANLILFANQSRKPLPRFWYLPFGKKAAVVMTGDDHANGGTAGRFDQFIQASPPGCSVADWECVRGTSYIYVGTPIADAQAAAYSNQGFEIGLHVNTNCDNFTEAQLKDFYTQQIAAFTAQFPSLPALLTERHHCIAWSDWITAAKVQSELHGIRLDTSYYYWPPTWVQNRPGFFTGSATPMRFADLDGGLIDNYLTVTHMTDESGQTYPFTVDTLLDRAVGPEENYGVYTINAHTDTAIETEATTTLASAKSHGVPVVSAKQMLTWLDGKGASLFSDLSWDPAASKLNFNLAPGAGANGLQAMLPNHVGGKALTGLTRLGSPVAYSVQGIKGMEYALFTAAATTNGGDGKGGYAATYAPDTTAPTVTARFPAQNPAPKAGTVVSATFSEAMDPATINAGNFQLKDPANIAVPAKVTYSALGRTATLTPNAALEAGTTYLAVLNGGGTPIVADLAGNPLAPNQSWVFTTEAQPCSAQPCSLWSANAVPGSPSDSDASAVELGVKFTSDTPGVISGIRFYKGAANTGTHIGSLWSNSGQLLARATFANETASGWQQVDFASPVAINANTVYVASYFAPNGHYAGDNDYFNVALDAPPLHAPASAAVPPGNGVYAYGASPAFPGNSFRASNYWVDVVFGVPAQALAITTTALGDAMVGAAYSATLTAVNGTTPYTWAITNGALPAGLDLDPDTGAIGGTPTAAGTATITVRVSDAAGHTDSAALSLTVRANDLAIQTGALPDASLGGAYSATLNATGGTLPYTWSLAAGSLPPGLSLDANSGAISGVPTAAGNFGFTARVASPSGSATKALSIAVRATASIWSATTVPVTADGGPDAPVEVGVKFKADAAGTITGLRFYKAVTNTGPHVANLWSADGGLLATATFTDETASGWQQVLFPTPVAIAANTVYVASYHTDTGHYSEDLNYFRANGVDHPPLHALQNGVSGANGVFRYGSASGFPNQGAVSTNYWVDVLYVRSPGTDVTAPDAPTGVSATPGTLGVVLDWSASGAADLAGYRVYRATAAAGPFTRIDDVAPTAVNYEDTLAPAGTSYYAVTAFDGGGNESAQSTPVAANQVLANQIPNPGFESSANGKTPDGWAINNQFTRGSASARSWDYSGRNFSTGNVAYSVTNTVGGLAANTNYTFAGWVNIPPTTDTFTLRVQVRWRNAANVVLRTDTVKSYTAATSGWDKASLAMVSPIGTRNAQILLSLSSLNATVYVDDFSLR